MSHGSRSSKTKICLLIYIHDTNVGINIKSGYKALKIEKL